MSDKPLIPGFRLVWSTETQATVYTDAGKLGEVFTDSHTGDAVWCARSPKQRALRTFGGRDLAFACEWLRIRHGQDAEVGAWKARTR